jgi:hypothetical protein
VILAEFLLGVFGPLLLGIFIATRSHSAGQVALAVYFVLLGVNYVPLLLYAITIPSVDVAREEVAAEIALGKREAMRKYRRGSLLLLIPLVVPVLAVTQRGH